MLYLIIYIITNFTWCYITPIMYKPITEQMPVFFYILRAFLLVFSLLLLLKISSILIKKQLNNFYKGGIAISLVFLVLFYIAELFFTFYAQTNGLNDTYTSVTWKYKHWRLNPQGFRDEDFNKLNSIGKTTILFTGDSYTEGHGIANTNDRYTDIIKNKYPNFTIYNAGKCGWGIFDEADLIVNMPIRPNYIFLQIFYNDFDYLLEQKKLSTTIPKNILFAETESKLFFAKYSVLFNYLYSNFNSILEKFSVYKFNNNQLEEAKKKYRIDNPLNDFPRDGLKVLEYIYKNSQLPKDSFNIYFNEIIEPINPYYSIMKDSAVFSNYINKLKYLNDICLQRNSKLILIPFPNFDKTSIQVFENFTYNYLLNELAKANLSYINLLPDLQKANLNQYSVNKYDAHANESSNAIIAQTIINYMNQKLGIH